MFWTAFVWGLGASCGGSLGVMLFVVMFFALQWFAGTKAGKTSLEYAELAQAALERRNELTERQIEHLDAIVECAKIYAYERELSKREVNS